MVALLAVGLDDLEPMMMQYGGERMKGVKCSDEKHAECFALLLCLGKHKYVSSLSGNRRTACKDNGTWEPC